MNLNQVILCGRLGKDPEMRYTPGGAAVTNFSIAVSSYAKKKDDDGFDEQTVWIDVTCWTKVAERVAQYAKAGTEVIVSGRIDTKSWEKDGQKHYRTFVTAMNVQMGQGRISPDESVKPEAPPANSSDAPSAGSADASPAPSADSVEDDLPF